MTDPKALEAAAQSLCKHTGLFPDGWASGNHIYTEELRASWRDKAVTAAQVVVESYLAALSATAPNAAEPVAFMFWNEPDTQRHFSQNREAIGSYWSKIMPLYAAPPIPSQAVAPSVEINPRRLFDDSFPDGYMESDTDYVLNNIDACVQLLDLALLPSASNSAAKEVEHGDWGGKDWSAAVCAKCSTPHRFRKRTPRQCRHCGIKFVYTASRPANETDGEKR